MKRLFCKRNGVAIFAGFLAVAFFPPVFSIIHSVCHGLYAAGAGGYEWNERMQQIASSRQQSSVSIFQLSTALIAALWGVIVLGADKPHEKVVSENPERWTIMLATLLLVYSGYFHLSYSDQLIYLQLVAESQSQGADQDMAFQDILASQYNASYAGQVLSLIAAAFVIAVAIATDLWVFEEKGK